MQNSFSGHDLASSMLSLEEISDISTPLTDNNSEKSEKSGSTKSLGSGGSQRSVVFQRRLDTTMEKVFKTGVDKVQSLFVFLQQL